MREATDEEYHNALARDAARYAANDEPALGGTRSEAAKNIVIVLNPSNKDSDALPEASNAHDVRFTYPFSRSNLGNVGGEPLRGVLNVDPKVMHRKIADMEAGASNVKENIALNRPLDGLRLKTDPSILKLFPKPKSVDRENFKPLFELRQSNLKLSSNDDSPKILGIAPAFKKISDLKLSPTLKNFSESKPLGLSVPKLSLNKSWKQIDDSTDIKTSPSNVDKQFLGVTKGRNVPRLGLPSSLPFDLSATRKGPFLFKNLLKLKDVELIPSKTTKINIELPSLKPVTRANNRLVSSPVNKDCDLEIEKVSTQSNIQFIPRAKKGKTEILDALPSASENSEVITNENPLQQHDSLIENTSENITMGNGQQFTDDFEAATTSNEEIDAVLNQNIENNPTQQLSKVPEVVEQDFDSYDDSFELITNENGPSGTDQLLFNIGNEPTNTEIIIGEESIPEMEEVNGDFDDTAQDTEQSTFLEGSDFGGVINEDEEIITSDHEIDSDSFILEKEAENKANIPADFRGAALCDCKTTLMPEEENQFIEENRNAETLKLEELPKESMLPKFEESIVLKLNNLHKPNGKILSISKFTKQDKNIAEANEQSSLDGSPSEENKSLMLVEKSTVNFDDGINTKNLQDISDSPLQQSYTDEDVRAFNSFECKANINKALNPNDPTQLVVENETFDNSDEGTHISDLKTLGSSHHTDIIETVTDTNLPYDQYLETNTNNDLANVDLKQGVIRNFNKESSCQAHVGSFKSATSDEEAAENISTESKPQEMEVGASEPFPTLTQVLQPSSLFPSSILRPPALPNLGDLLSGNSQLPAVPSLDDITASISNLFGSNERAFDDEELSSFEFDPTTDGSDDNPIMSTDASTNSKATILSQNPLENINLDIFQLSPLSQSRPIAYKIPSLNLNSFKTKLAVPKTLDFRPVKLQSSLGKDGSLLGATLTFGPSKLGATDARTPMFRSSLLNLKPSDILGNPLGNLPDLGDLSIPRINPLETLQATKTLGDNIRSHTENTVRNLQHSLASTLNEARTNNAGEKLATPRVDLLEMVTNAHEDMKDKLQGIHTDLKDRLETLQDHIKEQTKLPTLRLPPLPEVLQLESPFSEIISSGNLRASQPTKLIKKQRKPGFRVNKLSQKSKTGQLKPDNQQANLKPFKMSKAASSLTPKSVDVPKLTVTSVMPPFAKPLQRHSNVKLRESKLTTIQDPARFDQNRRPLLKLAENSLSTNSPNSRPVSSSKLFRSKQPHTTSSVRRLSTQENERPIVKLLRPKSKSRFEETSGFASEVRPRVKPNTRPKDILAAADRNQIRFSPGQASSLRTSSDKTISAPNLKKIRDKEMSSEKLPALNKSSFTLQNPTESSIIAKLRQSLKPKLSSPKLISEGNRPTNDMAKSASEDNAVILSQEPMKENVSYKCKMVCYREP